MKEKGGGRVTKALLISACYSDVQAENNQLSSVSK